MTERGPQDPRSLPLTEVTFTAACSVLGTAHARGDVFRCAPALVDALVRSGLATLHPLPPPHPREPESSSGGGRGEHSGRKRGKHRWDRGDGA